MPPSDPRECPALITARPGDDLPPGADSGWHRDGTIWDAVFGDGSSRPVTLLAGWHDRYRRRVVQLQWPASGDLFSECYLFDAEKVRRG